MSLLSVRTWTLRGRVVALCAGVGVVLAMLGVLAAITAAGSNQRLDNLLNKTAPIRTAAQDLATAYVDQETGVRGFAISGRAGNLMPYTNGRVQEQEILNRIKGMLGHSSRDDMLRGDVQIIEQRALTWRSEVAEPVIAAAKAGGSGDSRALGLAAGTTRFDELRGAVGKLQADVLVIRDEVADQARRSSSTLVSLEIIAALVVVLAGILLLILIDRLVSRPVVELAEQVRQVAEGDYDRQISSSGSPELRALARDVDAMRRQIVAELAEVRSARSEIEWVNDQLQQQTEELTRSNRDLEQFAYVASHDLQEPLRKVASFCQLLQRRYAGQLDERADQYIAFAVDGAQRMQRLINDLLAFSRIGRLTAGFTEVDLNQVLEQVRSQLEPRAGDDAEISWAGLPTVEGEEPLLTTLFVNLVGNALKFRRPDVAPVVRISAEGDDKEWRINVRDNGIGIEAEFADKVFVIFQRLHGRDAYEGTGIGLAIVKKIVEYHGGRIWLDLDVTEGTSIWFSLPLLAGVPVQEPLKEVTP